MNLQLPVHPVVDAVKKMMREQLLLQVASFAKKYPEHPKLQSLLNDEAWEKKFQELWESIDPQFRLDTLKMIDEMITWKSEGPYPEFGIGLIAKHIESTIITTKLMAQVERIDIFRQGFQ